MAEVPSYADLQAAIGQPCRLIGESGASCQASLIAVPVLDALDDSYTCYAAVVRLESGVDAHQANYQFVLPDWRSWPLMFTPGRLDVDGRRTMSAVIHVRSGAFSALS
ncbi:MAG: hypothetical protein JO142_01110 [Burkholderiales bacterium]|nr:hypothetical protein [Burkholderiales bacterium]